MFIAAERQRGSTLFFDAMFSPESSRPTLSRDLCMVETRPERERLWRRSVCLQFSGSVKLGQIIK